LRQQPFLDEGLYIIRRRDDQIETVAALAKPGQGGGVRGKPGDGYLYLVGLLEFRDQGGAGVVGPVIEMQLTLGPRHAGCAEQRHEKDTRG
jgi:hypothetical protein